MFKQILIGIFGVGIFVVLVGGLLYRPVIQPWHLRWGATDAEVLAALPGDEIVTGEFRRATRAIDIHAPASQVWPWLIQVGQGRGGLYSYDFLENLVGCDIHTLDEIVPELQDLQVGDIIRIGQQEALPYYRVARIEPMRAMVLQSVDPETGLVQGATWGFFLEEKEGGLTRLIIRHNDTLASDRTGQVIDAIVEPISFVMEHRMLHGIRDRAEGRYEGSLAAMP